ncbi:MAG: transposase, partial [Gammaproteobacteria bacterium]|nr:transposase [Gammaproteobacteria bacterium]
MTRPRNTLISLADTPFYHVSARCVRQAFLCGIDHYSGRNYEHRRQWVVDRIRLL